MVDNRHPVMRPEHAGHAGRLAILGVRTPAAASVRTSTFADAFRRCLWQCDTIRGRPLSFRPLRCSTSTRTGLRHFRSGLRDARHGARGRDVSDHPDSHGIAEGQCPGDEGCTSSQYSPQDQDGIIFIAALARCVTRLLTTPKGEAPDELDAALAVRRGLRSSDVPQSSIKEEPFVCMAALELAVSPNIPKPGRLYHGFLAAHARGAAVRRLHILERFPSSCGRRRDET